jgi:hypothetical protein
VVQSGGIAGLRSEHELDTERLPGDAAQRVSDLVRGVAFFALQEPPASQLPDVMHYRVRIDDGERSHEVAFDDACPQTSLLELVDCVTRLARARA